MLVDRTASGDVRLSLDDQEADIVRRLAEEMRALLRKPSSRDPVARRLFPDAYQDHADQQAYAELVGDDLERHKLLAVEEVGRALGELGRPAAVVLAGDALDTWLAFLTDLRLAIGTRVDVDEERMAADVDPRDPHAPALTLLHWLGWIQESIIHEAADG